MGSGRAWTELRYDERREVTQRTIHRLWRDEGLQVKIRSQRKRSGVSSIPPIEADTPNMLWAIDFQFDSTIEGKAINIASMVDEHARESVLNIVERSITAELLVAELTKVLAVADGPPQVLRMDNGREFISQALQEFCDRKMGMSYIPPGTPWNNGHIESFNNRLRKEASTATTGTPFSRPAWSSATSSRTTTTDTTRPWATPRPPSTLPPADTPTPQWPARSTKSGSNKPDSSSGLVSGPTGKVRPNWAGQSVSTVAGDDDLQFVGRDLIDCRSVCRERPY